MNPRQIALVQSSFLQVLPIADTAASLFYGRLFELDPSLRSMFQGDMTLQGRKLMTMIGMVVNSLNRMETILPTVRSLGRRHSSYGVEEQHYDTVGAALLWTLRQGLGEAFTLEVETAWAETYGLLANTMKTESEVPA